MVVTPTGDRLNLELYNAGNVMTKPVRTLRKLERASRVARALLDTSHGGFPIVANVNVDGSGGDNGDAVVGEATFVGLITRAELLIILLRYWEGGKEVCMLDATKIMLFPITVHFWDSLGLWSSLDDSRPNKQNSRKKTE